jgi:nucleoid-associated protein YgaU
VRLPWQRRGSQLSARVAQALERGGVVVNELAIEAQRGRITLRGSVPSREVRQRAVELVRAVDGVRAVDDRLGVTQPAALVPAVAERRRAPRVYIAHAGDTLPDIAERLYGRRARWVELLRHNEQVVSDPFVLQPGLRLRLPAD